MTLLLNRGDVETLLTMSEAIQIVEEALKQLALGNVVMPQRTAIRIAPHRGLHLGMPAYIGGEMDALALKVVTVYPDNPKAHGLPTTIGLLLLNDARTGAPLAVMDAGLLTAMRTGAVSGVAARHLARKNAKKVGVFGAGIQAQTQLIAICEVRPIESAVVYDTDPSKAQSYADQMSKKLALRVSVAGAPRDAVEGMDILIAASSASQPLFSGDLLEPGQHVNGVGAHSATTREFDTAAMLRSKIVPDSLEACLVEAGELMIPISEGALKKEQIHASLGEIVAGMKPGRENDQEITFFKSVGLALQDVSTANHVYKKALASHRGVEFSFS